MNEQDINSLLDQAQDAMKKATAEARNTLHACKKGHPLSCGDRAKDFWNAAFALSGRCDQRIVVNLNKIGEYFANKRQS